MFRCVFIGVVDKDTAAHCNAVFLSIASASGYFLVASGFSFVWSASGCLAGAQVLLSVVRPSYSFEII
jgi:hypothetical protein